MISKGEAIVRLKKMGVTVADDQSIVTILLPKETSLAAGIKDIREKMNTIDYNASFCIRQKSDIPAGDVAQRRYEPETEEEVDAGAEEMVIPQEEVSEEELKGSLLSMDDDGQFTLGGFGMDF